MTNSRVPHHFLCTFLILVVPSVSQLYQLTSTVYVHWFSTHLSLYGLPFKQSMLHAAKVRHAIKDWISTISADRSA
jgi:hypothetical protein